MEEERLIDERMTVEGGHQPVAGPDHFPGQLGVVGLVGIHETGVAKPPEDHDPDNRGPPQTAELVAHAGTIYPAPALDPAVLEISHAQVDWQRLSVLLEAEAQARGLPRL